MAQNEETHFPNVELWQGTGPFYILCDCKKLGALRPDADSLIAVWTGHLATFDLTPTPLEIATIREAVEEAPAPTERHGRQTHAGGIAGFEGGTHRNQGREFTPGPLSGKVRQILWWGIFEPATQGTALSARGLASSSYAKDVRIRGRRTLAIAFCNFIAGTNLLALKQEIGCSGGAFRNALDNLPRLVAEVPELPEIALAITRRTGIRLPPQLLQPAA